MFSGNEFPEADPGDRHVFGERAPEDQQVNLALFLFSYLQHPFLRNVDAGKKIAVCLRCNCTQYSHHSWV
jgi:hypothetical protein